MGAGGFCQFSHETIATYTQYIKIYTLTPALSQRERVYLVSPRPVGEGRGWGGFNYYAQILIYWYCVLFEIYTFIVTIRSPQFFADCPQMIADSYAKSVVFIWNTI